MADLLADMERRRQARKLAIQEGIAKRLPELGFVRKSGKLYLREDENFKEWVEFEISGSNFGDTLGCFSKDFGAYYARCFPDHVPADPSAPKAYHVIGGAILLWRDTERDAEAVWESSRDWWNPIDWFRRPPHKESSGSSFVTDGGYWHPDVDAAGCAAFSAAKWQEYVEPWRDAVRSDRAIFVENFGRWNLGAAYNSIVCHAYLGETAQAEAICRRILGNEGLPPSNEELRSRRRSAAQKEPEDVFIRNWIASSHSMVSEVRRIAPILGLTP